MKQLGDKLVKSPVCNSNACYESEFQTEEGIIKTWLCMTSGYTSNTTMTKDSAALKQTLELTPNLIKDLRQDHEPPGGGEVLAWFPTCITMPEKGMIFPEPQTYINKNLTTGEEKEEKTWGWTVVKAINIPKEDQHKFPDPRNPGTNYTRKMDMKGKKSFRKMQFTDAAEELGMFAQEEASKIRKGVDTNTDEQKTTKLPKLKLPKLKK